MESQGGYTATINARLTLQGKRQAGVSCEDIVAKELSLMGVQRPLQRGEIPTNSVQVFQWGEFAGFVIET
jgi:tRNA (cmo5U34)-methyltransferase